ncbi:hypothetical protein [Streptomyces sp. NPDC048606]|uniref:hypothetical protein n=1 Tax=Streptomyces sp. NPDC048606 TaxID=3154726 RepID=UPI00341B553F
MVRRPVMGEVRIEYGQIHVWSDPASGSPDLTEALAGQGTGLCGAAVAGTLWLNTGLHTGRVGFVVEVLDEEPALDPVWEDVVEVSFRPGPLSTTLAEWGGGDTWELGLPPVDTGCGTAPGAWTRRGSARSGCPESRGSTTTSCSSGPRRPPRTDCSAQTSRAAAYWHRVARELPPPPTPEQRAETERLAREAYERAVEEERAHHERWAWGGRPPSEALRGIGGNVARLLPFDSDLVHALGAEDPDTQRAVAVLAARRACEAAGLDGLAWVDVALTAVTEGRRPLPPPFHEEARLWEAVYADSGLPDRWVVEAVPPERPPYVWPPLPAAPPGPTDARQRRSRLGRGLRGLIPPDPSDDEVPVMTVDVGYRVAAQARRTLQARAWTSQMHAALPTVLAAAEADPLKAALEAVWHAVNTYGEHHRTLLDEVRALCVARRTT